MSALSIRFGRLPFFLHVGESSADRGTLGPIWTGRTRSPQPEPVKEVPQHGCTVVRRITDDRGREWRVRQLWSENCHGLLFQCSVRGIRSEVRPMRAPLESLTDDELITALAPADD